MTIIRALLAGLAAALFATGAAHAGPTLDAIKSRGSLRCAVNTGLQGFAAPDSQGRWSGIDVDFCRALAAAILGDPAKVEFRPTNTQNRFTTLQTGEVDVLSHNTTWSASRDSALGLVFAGILFYDGQGFMVPKSLGVQSARELDGATVCILPGTTTELNLTDWFRAHSMQYKPVVIGELSQILQAFFAGRCDVFTSDISGLASVRQGADRPDDYVILPEAISKEPLGPAVRRDDWELFAIVRWTLFGLIEAEEHGITSANVEELRKGAGSPAIQRMLGGTGEIGKGLGLSPDWLARVVATVGNYGEIYERNIGPLGIPRGQNALWKDGGLMYAPPIR